MSVANCTTIVGVFYDRSEAVRAIDELGKAGFRNDQIGIVCREPQWKTVVKNRGEAETYMAEGAVAGALAGASIGGLMGMGILAGVIPVIGPAIAAGTLATILTSAAGGAAIAGLGGALVGWGIPEEHAKYYESQLQAGRIVVTVHADDCCDIVHTILENHGGYNYASLPRYFRPCP
ncbi:MAG: general stress protein [Planctomycetota bacterium]